MRKFINWGGFCNKGTNYIAWDFWVRIGPLLFEIMWHKDLY